MSCVTYRGDCIGKWEQKDWRIFYANYSFLYRPAGTVDNFSVGMPQTHCQDGMRAVHRAAGQPNSEVPGLGTRFWQREASESETYEVSV